jgi:hypothetical protein
MLVSGTGGSGFIGRSRFLQVLKVGSPGCEKRKWYRKKECMYKTGYIRLSGAIQREVID